MLSYTGIFLLFINLLISLTLFRYVGKALRIFTFYQAVVLVIQIYSSILSTQGQNNLFLSHYYFIGQFLFLSAFYFVILKKGVQRRTIIAFLPAVLLTLAIQYTLTENLYVAFNYLEIFVTSLPIAIYSSFHFYNLLDTEKRRFYHINMGIITYLLGSTVIFLSGNLINIVISESGNKMVWNLNSLLYIGYQLLVMTDLIALKSSGKERMP